MPDGYRGPAWFEWIPSTGLPAGRLGVRTVTQWFPLFLLLHVLAAIVAFGPVFAFPLIGRMGGSEPQHANFSTRVSAAVSRRITIPAALTMPVSGVLMIWSTGIDWAQLWLITGVALYTFAVSYAVLVQGRAVARLIQLTSGPPPSAGPGPAGSGALAGGPGAGGLGPGGPPPEIAATVQRIQRGGMLLMAVIAIIVSLMVFRPTI
jgi:uncharacterized membrane protein